MKKSKGYMIIAGLIAGFLFAAVVFTTGVFAAQENKNTEASKNVKEPTVVTSQKMTTDQKAKTALLKEMW